jgi:hypothetical protein
MQHAREDEKCIQILVGIREEKRIFGRPDPISEDNIKVCLKKTVCEDSIASDWVQWRVLLSIVMHIQIS